MSEIRRKILNFPRYEVTEEGDVYNQNGLKLKQEKTRNGYLRVSLSDGKNKHKRMSVHRLVAEAFIPNPNNLPQVDHKNEIKTDNHVSNLRWVTPLENLEHSRIIEKASKAKFTKIRCITTGEIFSSIKEACETYGLSHSNIVSCCNGRRNKCGGMEWEYVEERRK